MKRTALLTMHSCPLGQAGERDTGGMNVYALALGRHLAARGVAVDLYTRAHDGAAHPNVTEAAPNLRILHVPAGPSGAPKLDLHTHTGAFADGVDAIRSRDGLTYDLVHSHYWVSALAGVALASRWGTPHVTSFHTAARIKSEAHAPTSDAPEREHAEARIATSVDRIIAWTDHEADALARLYGAPRDRITVMPIGVDLTRFHPRDKDAARVDLGIPADAETLLYAGRLDPIKGARVLLEATALLRDRPRLDVRIAGGEQAPGDLAQLRDAAKDLGITNRVHWLGAVPHDRMPTQYAAADLFVVPSFYESFSIATAEALACGTAVVAARVPGPEALIRDGVAGRLVAPGQAADLASALRDLLDDSALRARMAEAAPVTVAHLDWPVIADRVLTIYDEVAAGANGRIATPAPARVA